MDDTRSDRWMALAGPLFLLLVVVAVVLEGSAPSESASAKEVVDHYVDAKDKIFYSVFLAVPAAALLLIVTSRLRAAFGQAAGAAATLFQSGAVLYAAALTTGAAVMLGALGASDNGYAEVAQTFNVFNEDLWIPMVAGIAALLLGGGLAVLRTGVLPRWLGWVGVVVGVVSLVGPGGFLGFFVTPFWIAIAGVLLYTRDGANPATT
jgi:hypothetical protein